MNNEVVNLCHLNNIKVSHKYYINLNEILVVKHLVANSMLGLFQFNYRDHVYMKSKCVSSFLYFN